MKILLATFLILPLIFNAQVSKDSLWQVWKNESLADTIRIKAIHSICWNGYMYTQPDSAFYFAQLQYEFAKSKGLKKQMADALNIQGVSFKIRGNNEKALELYTKSLKIQEAIKDKKGIGRSLGNMGSVYKDQGDYISAIDNYSQSIKIFEEIGEKKGLSSIISNIGNIYFSQGDYNKAIENHIKSLEISEEINDKTGVALSLMNMGNVYLHKHEIAQAMNYYKNALEIHEEVGNKIGIASSLNNIGNIYRRQGELSREECKCENDGNNYSSAMSYFIQSLNIHEEIGDFLGMTTTLGNIGDIHYKLGEYKKAKEYLTRSLLIAKEVGITIEIGHAAQTLWQINKKLGKYKESLEMYELHIKMRDSINSEENQKELIRQEYKYNYEKQKVTDSITSAEAEKVHLANLEAEKAKGAAQKKQNIFLFIGLGLVAFFAFFMYNRYKITQKQKGIIEEKEKETSLQKGIVEEKHKEITDSINYAERIQRSFLATSELLDKNLKDYFVFFKPKDVVSGDFYWASPLKNGNFAFCCADSTGHGVPGAIMSILNIYSLEKAIEKETEPHHILNKTRALIIERLKKDGSPEGGKDGMDCSLLVLNQEKTQLTFASAYNPVFIIRNDELLEFKGDKMPVGKYDKDQIPFTLQTVSLQKGDVIYSLTDGMPDQFGGEKGKKFMIKNLKNLLLSFAELPMKQQEEKLKKEFASWKGEHEQVDDVCIIGIRL